MTVVRASVKGNKVELDTPDGSLSGKTLELSPQEALFLLASLQQSLVDLPATGVPVDLQLPSFVGSPDFAVGLASTGDTAVRFTMGGLPAMEFHFSNDGVSKLRADLKKALLTPRQSRSKQ